MNSKRLFYCLIAWCAGMVITASGLYAQHEAYDSKAENCLYRVSGWEQSLPAENNYYQSLFTLVFYTNGGSEVKSIMADSAAIIDLTTDDKIPEKANSVFAGWYDRPDLKGAAIECITLDKHVILYAKWLPAVKEDLFFVKKTENQTINMVAYPNPIGVGQMLTLEFGVSREALHDAAIKIIDFYGNVTKTVKTLTPSMQIAMPQKQGQYMIVLYRSGNEVSVLKIMIR